MALFTCFQNRDWKLWHNCTAQCVWPEEMKRIRNSENKVIKQKEKKQFCGESCSSGNFTLRENQESLEAFKKGIIMLLEFDI